MSHDQITQLRSRAGVLIELDRAQEAIPLLLKALEFAPEDADLLAQLSQTLYSCGDYDAALRYADQAIAADPQAARGFRARCTALGKTGDAQGALQAAREATGMEPELPANLRLLADCLLECDLRAEAEATANMLLELTPDSPGAHHTMARVYVMQRRWREAEAMERAALALDPTADYALRGLGYALWQQGQRSQALEFYYDALRLQPAEGAAQDLIQTIASLYLLPAWLGNYGGALIIVALFACSLVIWWAESYSGMVRDRSIPAGLVFFIANGWYLLFYPEDYCARYRNRCLNALSPELRTYLQTRQAELGRSLVSLKTVGFAVAGNALILLLLMFFRNRLIPIGPREDRLLVLSALWIIAMAVMSAFNVRRLLIVRKRPVAMPTSLVPAEAATVDLETAMEAVAYAPDSPGTLKLLFEAQLTSQQVADAGATVERLQTVAPHEIQTKLAAARLELERKRWRQAEALAREALGLEPDSAEAMTILGKALLGQDKVRDAIICHYQVLQRNSADAEAKKDLDDASQRYSFPTAQGFVAFMIFVYLTMRLSSGNGVNALYVGLVLTGLSSALLYKYAPKLLLARYRSFREIPGEAQSLIVELWKSQWAMQLLVAVLCVVVEFLVFCIVSEPILQIFHR